MKKILLATSNSVIWQYLIIGICIRSNHKNEFDKLFVSLKNVTKSYILTNIKFALIFLVKIIELYFINFT